MLKEFLTKSFFIKYIVLGTLLALYIFFSFKTFKDYGITLDEPRVYTRGQELAEYLSHKTSYKNTIEPTFNLEPKKQRHAPILSEYHNLYAAGLSKLNNNLSFERYHFLNMMFASLLIIFSYLAFFKKYQNVFIAIIPPLFIFFTPRILGHIPANPKDIPFAVMYTIALFTIYLLEKSEKQFFKDLLIKSLILGIVFGLTQSFRVVGYSIYIVYLIYILLDIRSKEDKEEKKYLRGYYFKIFFLTIIFSHFLMMVTWPYIGSNFISNLKNVLIGSTTFVEWDKEFLFAGNTITPETRPQSYLPVWILITTPSFILLFFFLSIIKIKEFLKHRLFLLLFLSFLVHTIIYFVVKPNIYNGLRHYLFYLVNIVLMASFGFIETFYRLNKKMYRFVLILAALVCLSFTIIDLKNLHPYEYTYFNKVTGGMKLANGKFPIDYWGASFKEASDWILEDIAGMDQEILVMSCNSTNAVEYYGRGEFQTTKEKLRAHYIICQDSIEGLEPIYEIKRNGIVLNNVY